MKEFRTYKDNEKAMLGAPIKVIGAYLIMLPGLVLISGYGDKIATGWVLLMMVAALPMVHYKKADSSFIKFFTWAIYVGMTIYPISLVLLHWFSAPWLFFQIKEFVISI